MKSVIDEFLETGVIRMGYLNKNAEVRLRRSSIPGLGPPPEEPIKRGQWLLNTHDKRLWICDGENWVEVKLEGVK